jgi:uncharacterized lipoprotein NlpE involved in copper resistance
MKGGNMKYLIFILLLVTALVTTGCVNKNQDTAIPPTDTTTLPLSTPEITTALTTIQTPESTPIPPSERKITDGFWCRDTTRNIGKDPTDVRECYQFFTDGTYTWGYSPGRAMGKSLSCSGDPGAKCEYSFNANGQYEVEGGYFYTLSGDALIDPHDPPYFIWSSTGIP